MVNVFQVTEYIAHNITFVTVLAFEICTANRYKLNKKYQKLKAQSDTDPDNLRLKNSVAQAKVSGVAFVLDVILKVCFADLSIHEPFCGIDLNQGWA